MRTLNMPSDERLKQMAYNKLLRDSGNVELDAGQKFAAVVLFLNPAVSQPGDYATLATNIKAVAGIDDIQLLVDGECEASIPVDKQLKLYLDVNLRRDDVPVVE